MTKLVKIGQRLVNPDNVTYIIDREIHFNDGSRWVATEPEIQDLLALMFEHPRVTVEAEPLVVKKATVVAKKATKK
jgi:hypothetical protein